MTHHTINSNKDHLDLLNQVRQGMTVYDSSRNNMGSVETVVFGAMSDEELANGVIPATAPKHQDTSADNNFVEGLVAVFDPRDQIPDELAKRLHYSGYILIDGGWFGANRYVTPDQISSVDDEAVYINTNLKHVIHD